MVKRVKCPECGNQLVYETFGQYGLAQKINSNGKVQKKRKRIDYGGADAFGDMVYCPSCGWTVTADQFSFDGLTVSLLQDGGAKDA